MISGEGLPMQGSEDFSYFLLKKPGCFFFLGGAKKGEDKKILHASNFDYNDDMIPYGAYLWAKIAENLFKTKFDF